MQGGSYDTAVVVTKNNEEGTIGSALRASHPDRIVQAVANSNANLQKLSEYKKNLSTVKEDLNNNGEYEASEFLHNLALSFGRNNDNGLSQYVNIGNNVSLRIASHYANAENYNNASCKREDNYGIVIKLSPARFKKKGNVNYVEYVYFPDKLNGERQSGIIDGLLDFLSKGDFSRLPKPDKIHVSGEFVDRYKEKGFDVNNNGDVRYRVYSKGEKSEALKRAEAATKAEEFGEGLNTKVETVHSASEVENPEVRAALERGERVKGWYDIKTGNVYLYQPNITDKYDAQKTIAHEVIGHKE